MAQDLFENILGGAGRLPAPHVHRHGRVENHPRNVERPTIRTGFDLVVPQTVATPGAQLRQGSRGEQTTADVEDSRASAVARRHLSIDECGDIRWMQTISHLVAVAAESDVAERALSQPAVQP